MKTKEELQSIFDDAYIGNDDAEGMIAEFRSLAAENEISREEYDYLIENWNELEGNFIGGLKGDFDI